MVVPLILDLGGSLVHGAEMIKLSSSLWSDLRDIDFRGSNACCLFYDGLAVLDLSNINSPSQIGQVELTDHGLKVTTTGDYAYIATEDSFLYVLDISSVSDPTLMGNFKMPDVFTGIETKDNCVYASARNSGLLVVDVSDPFNAAVIGSCRVEGFQPLSFCLHGNLAYLCGIGGLRLVNVLFPRFPYLFSSCSSAPGANRVFVTADGEETYAYLSNPIQLSIQDVTNPRDIQPVSVYTPSSDIVDLTVLGNHAYLAAGYEELMVLDVEEQGFPQEVAALSLGGYTTALYSFSDFLFVSDLFGPARIVNVFNPRRPYVAGRWIIPGSPRNVALRDRLAFVVCVNSGLHVMDVEDPGHPRLVSTLHAPYNNNDVDLEGDYAYLTALLTGMQVVDVSDPSSPMAVSQYRPEGYTYGVEVEDGYAYLRNSGNELQIVDVHNPVSPVPRGSVQTPGTPQEILVRGNHLYVADLAAGLTIVDLTNKDNPQVTVSFPTPGSCTNLFSTDSLMFLVCQDVGVEICDLSDPEAPESLGVYSTVQTIEDICVEDEYAYLSLHHQRIEVVDISEPSDPTLVTDYGSLDNPGGLTVNGRNVYLCDGRSFKILRFLPSPRPSRVRANQLDRIKRTQEASSITP